MSHPTLLILKQNFTLKSPIFRRSARMAIAMFIAVLIYRLSNVTQGFWVPLTVAIVMQTTTAATLRKGLQRFLGTVIGIMIGILLLHLVHSAWMIDALLICFLFLAYALKSFNLVNYGIFVVPLSIMVTLLV